MSIYSVFVWLHFFLCVSSAHSLRNWMRVQEHVPSTARVYLLGHLWTLKGEKKRKMLCVCCKTAAIFGLESLPLADSLVYVWGQIFLAKGTVWAGSKLPGLCVELRCWVDSQIGPLVGRWTGAPLPGLVSLVIRVNSVFGGLDPDPTRLHAMSKKLRGSLTWTSWWARMVPETRSKEERVVADETCRFMMSYAQSSVHSMEEGEEAAKHGDTSPWPGKWVILKRSCHIQTLPSVAR